MTLIRTANVVARLLPLCGLLLVSRAAWSYEFVPTDAEFASWPTYCQARYVTTYVGWRSQWVATYPQATIDLWKKQLGAETFEYVHHYCAGIIWLERARFEPDKHTRAFYLSTAEEEALFTHRGVPKDSPIRPAIYVTLSQIEEEKGEHAKALEYLSQAITTRPDDALAYGALAVIQRKQGRLDLARDTLLKGDAATHGESAEIHYNLGLIYLELGNAEAAQAQAKRAYELGYPLPGLKKKLVKAGYWQDEPVRAAD
jgi:tetratricopeptide (TPR) repeat protein